MTFTSLQYNLEEVIVSSLKFKLNIPSLEKLTSAVKRRTRSSFLTDDSSRSLEGKRQK